MTTFTGFFLPKYPSCEILNKAKLTKGESATCVGDFIKPYLGTFDRDPTLNAYSICVDLYQNLICDFSA